ncbi:MAG TPA: DUF1572 family protein [Chitinophagales bacterium]|nr:DUF1572 family protein [Chitinophagales bacterium]
MLNETFIYFFERDLNKLKEELSAYGDEQKLWVVEKGISNSAGNLCLHLIGNLNHFIGATLGGTGYVRHRDNEFSDKNVPRAEMLTQVDATLAMIKATLDQLADADMAKDFPLQENFKGKNTAHVMVQLVAHLEYHLGQINYHRRLIGN